MKNKRSFGVDFGTSNSAIASFFENKSQVVSLTSDGHKSDRSVLFFPKKGQGETYSIGEKAVQDYIKSGMSGRLIQSIKSAMKSVDFEETQIYGKSYGPIELVSLILKYLKSQAETKYGMVVEKAAFGRPVFFSTNRKEDEFIENRLRLAAEMAGFKDVTLVFEPVAAAYYYESTLKTDETILVADFGAGTTDYCILKVGPRYAAHIDSKERVLATGGVYVGGDDFDKSLFWSVVTPYLGRGAKFMASLTNELTVSSSVFHQMLDWEKIWKLQTPREIEVIKNYLYNALPEFKMPLARLIRVLMENLTYQIYREVERLKFGLSEGPFASMEYVSLDKDLSRRVDIELVQEVSQDLFAREIVVGQIEKMEIALNETFEEANMRFDQIDRVFLTGGTSLVSAVKALFESRFGQDRIDTKNSFNSVAQGLALFAGQCF